MRRHILFAVALLLLATAWCFLRPSPAEELPRKQLSGGGEFRVVQISYGSGKPERHYLGRAPEPLIWMWRHLPAPLQRKVPMPSEGISASGHSDRIISIWWTWFDGSGRPELGPTDHPLMTLDSGEQVPLGWPRPVDEFRQIIVPDPPRDSKRLRFSLLVEEEQVKFEIPNPAFEP